MKNSRTFIAGISAIVLMLLSVTFGHANQCVIDETLRYSVLTEQIASVLSVAFNRHPRQNRILAVGRSDGTIRLWNTRTRQLLHVLEEHTQTIFALAFSPDGSMLASGSGDGTVRLWKTSDIENWTTIAEHQGPFTEHTDIVLSLTFSADSKVLASGSRDGVIRFWDPDTGNSKGNIGDGFGDPPVLSLAFSPIKTEFVLATARADNAIRLWNLNEGRLQHTLTGHTDIITSLAFSTDGSALASASADSTVKVWNTNIGGDPLHTLEGHTDWVNSVAFNTTMLATAGFDNTVFLWEADAKNRLHTLDAHINSVEAVAFSADGKTLVSGDADGKVLLWELTPTQIVADVNNDTFINIADMQAVDSSLGLAGQHIAEDVNCDGTVNISDLVLVANAMESAPTGQGLVTNGADVNGNGIDISDLEAVDAALGKTGSSLAEDVNKDGVVNISDLVLVANEIDPGTAAAPTLHNSITRLITAEQVQGWLTEARLSTEISPAHQRGILVLEQLLAMLKPKTTALLPNYPNPFNPETWLPYQLAVPADVTVTIYAADGSLIRTLELGYQATGIYQSRARAAYWDGRNNSGERVASGVYFWTLTAGDFTAIRKLSVRK